MRFDAIAFLCALIAVVSAGDWSVVCSKGSSCPEYPFDAVLRGDGTVVLAGADANGGGLFSTSPSSNEWTRLSDKFTYGLEHDLYTWDIMATTRGPTGTSLLVSRGNSSTVDDIAFDDTVTVLTRPSCHFMGSPLRCAVVGSRVTIPGYAHPHVGANSTGADSHIYWDQHSTDIEASHGHFTSVNPYFNTYVGSRARWPYTSEDASADLKAGCLRLTPTRCIAVGPSSLDPQSLFMMNARLVSAAPVDKFRSEMIITNSFDVPSWNVVFAEETGSSERIPEGYAINSVSCGIFQAQHRICVAVGQSADGQRAVWMNTSNGSQWYVMTNADTAAGLRSLPSEEAAALKAAVRDVDSPFIKEMHSLVYNFDTRSFFAAAVIIDKNGTTRPAVVTSPYAGSAWVEYELPAEAAGIEEITSVRNSVVDGCGHLTVLGRSKEGGNTFVAHKKIYDNCRV